MRLTYSLTVLLLVAGCQVVEARGSQGIVIRESIEWAEIRVLEADKTDLPRVLLIGDSISGGYFQGVAMELRGHAYVARLGTSKALGDPALLSEIKLLLDQYQFAVIHFNIGLHGWGYGEETYRANFPKLLALLRKNAPGAKLIWATTTPCRTGAQFQQFDPKNDRVKARNKIATEFIAQAYVPANDLYAMEENHPEHFADGVHFTTEAANAQAKQVARFISEAMADNAALPSKRIVSDQELAKQILEDGRFETVETMALKLLSGFSAGTSYGEIWIRDFNTFINGSLHVHDKNKVKEMLLLFFKVQGNDGNIPDGIISSANATVGYQYTYSPLLPGWAAHKNTVETDQESSLIQAVRKYIQRTGDRSILSETVGGVIVLQRMESALQYVMKNRWSAQYGLVIGATTIDWGDMQAQEGWGVAINEKTRWAIDVYDNAMFVSAIADFHGMLPKEYKTARDWEKTATALKRSIRKYLWDAKGGKYIPHLYLNGSPFSSNFDENKILYTGGTTCAILAGLHSKKEIIKINGQFLKAAAREAHATIGVTVVPPYPLEAFPNVPPYSYQNGGDWTWFGGRMIQALAANGLTQEAYTELSPMIDRVLKNKGFFEWYDVRTGEAKGSGDFRGEAGVLYDAIEQLRAWAKERAR